ncbi:MAG: hypothetical protein FWC69_03510 [Defluviitaleaceae bacterium]|nr:hypothetical protein [Defluviitaleaceae bacterium]
MKEDKSILGLFLGHTITTFACTVIATTMIGWIFVNFSNSQIDLSILGSEGLAYAHIAQILGLSTVLGALITLLTSDIVLKQTMLLWRCALLLFLSLVACGLFVIIFRWFPLDLWQAWLSFLLSFVVFFILGIGSMLLKTKLEDKKYKKLLSSYKERSADE